jgi:hypothetical protein
MAAVVCRSLMVLDAPDQDMIMEMDALNFAATDGKDCAGACRTCLAQTKPHYPYQWCYVDNPQVKKFICNNEPVSEYDFKPSNYYVCSSKYPPVGSPTTCGSVPAIC